MPHGLQNSPDSTRDTKLENDLPRPMSVGDSAQIGDSITVTLGGDRIKVTLLSFIDPADVDDPQWDSLIDRFADLSDDDDRRDRRRDPSDTRYAAIELKLRNLDAPGYADTVHVSLSGALVDANGGEHRASMTGLKGRGSADPPQRGQPSSIGSVAFRLPVGSIPESYILGYSGKSYATFNLRSDPSISEAAHEPGHGSPLEILKQGADVWNKWRKTNPRRDINLANADLRNMNLERVNLSGANLGRARFHDTNLCYANLRGAFAEAAHFNGARLHNCNFDRAQLSKASFLDAQAYGASFRRADLTRASLDRMIANKADFSKADLREVHAWEANFAGARCTRANLSEAQLRGALLIEADLQGADFTDAEMNGVFLRDSNLGGARLHNVKMFGGDLYGSDLSGADIRNSDLSLTSLVSAKLDRTVFSNCRIFGISAWNIRGTPALQEELVITAHDEGRLTVSDLEIAQFIYLLLNYKRLQTVFNAMTERGVLLLGRFGGGGIELLRQIAARLRDRGYMPIIFEFERPEDRDLTETVKTLVGLSRFVIVDLSGPSVPQELMATVPAFEIPFIPILEKGTPPYTMFPDILKYPWVLKPIVEFTDADSLLADLSSKIVAPAEERVRARQKELRERYGRS
jgi:uncharacterized protein YjbI with pentapeptide repeats